MQAGKFALRAVVLAIAFFWAQTASAQGAAISTMRPASAVTACRGSQCARADGSTRSLFVSGDQLAKSVHGKALALHRLPYDDNRTAA